MKNHISSGVLILDFGSQYTQLIARRFREIGVYSEVHPYNFKTEDIKIKNPAAIVLSGGPRSVTASDGFRRNVKELLAIAPVFGVCYGMQLVVQELGGEVKSSDHREYGLSKVLFKNSDLASQFSVSTDKIQNGSELNTQPSVWMSHGDVISKIPKELKEIATSENGFPAVLEGKDILCVQFHPEVTHTQNGVFWLDYFLKKAPRVEKNWKPQEILQFLKSKYQSEVKEDEDILCGLSGGVDSTVTATLLTKIFGPDRVKCIFVDTGLLRKNEFEDVLKSYDGLGLNVKGVKAEKEFLNALKGKSDPEDKRIAIGHTFIKVFKDSIPKGENIKWLAQGTLYPDVIESVSPTGSSVTIKSHHNVGGLPKDLNLKLIEPLRDLFKDEVRRIGKSLDIPAALIERHPFPGPGLGIRILGEINSEDIKILQEADSVYIDEIKKSGLYNSIWQAFAVLLPVRAVGVQGDQRTYDKVIALRAVTSVDGMTAHWYPFDFEFLTRVSNRITNEVKGVNRVVYDVSSKPPGTIEWE